MEPTPQHTRDKNSKVSPAMGGFTSLTIPCKPEYVSLCRLVAGTLGSCASLDDEAIADLKLVVTEACTCFILSSNSSEVSGSVEPPAGPRCVQLDLRVGPESWEVTVLAPDGRGRIPSLDKCDPMSEGGLGLTIIRALVDSMEQTESNIGGSVLRLVKRLSPYPISTV